MQRQLMQPLRGIVPPLITPLLDEGTLDVDGFERLIERVIDGGVHGLFVLGTTGEGPSLPIGLRREVIRQACRFADSRVPVYAGISDTCFAESVALGEFAADEGCEAAVSTVPFYLPISQDGVREHFERLAGSVPLPLVLYNFPTLCSNNIEPETVRALLDVESIVGLKDSSGDMRYFGEVVAACSGRPDFSLLVGPEGLLTEALSLGGVGGVSGGANIWPELFVSLYSAWMEEDRETADRLRGDVARLGEVYQVGPMTVAAVVARTKVAVSLCGTCGDVVCPPLTVVPEEERQQIAGVLERLGLLESDQALLDEADTPAG